MIKHPIILLFGMPRSGTTWIGKIFDSHMRTLYRHEPDTWNKIKEIPLLENSECSAKYADFINGYVEQFVLSRRPEINGKIGGGTGTTTNGAVCCGCARSSCPHNNRLATI